MGSSQFKGVLIAFQLFILRGGVFAIKGHAVTFPQDITDMCNHFPQKKDNNLTFIGNIRNRIKSSSFPTSIRVLRQQVLDTLFWLKRHNGLLI